MPVPFGEVSRCARQPHAFRIRPFQPRCKRCYRPPGRCRDCRVLTREFDGGRPAVAALSASWAVEVSPTLR